MDGIKSKIACPPQRHAEAQDLPFSLPEAIAALRDDHVMCEALGQQFVDWFALTKTETEIGKLENLSEVEKDDLQKERDLYLML